MNIKNRALKYHKTIMQLNIAENNNVLRWIGKYNIMSPSRSHLFYIIEDIQFRPTCRIVDQGAAEGIVCRILQDAGHDVFAVDSEPSFKECWDILNVNGVIGDCTNNKWWPGLRYDVIIAGVWVACKGKKSNVLTKKRDKYLTVIRDNWVQILHSKGIVYFDVNAFKFPIKPLVKIFEEKFKVQFFKQKPRNIIKCEKL